MPEPGYVFISYARADRKFVDRLSRDLMVAGIPLWRDVDNIRPGTNWQKEIESAVGTASGLIYVASRNAAESPWIEHELQLMLDRSETRVFPLILDDAGANRLPAFLQRIQWVDFRESYERALDRLIEAISHVVELSEPSKPTAAKSKGYVFLSYAEDDLDFVTELRQFLQKHGYAYWDYNESDRDYHGQLFLELERVIKDAAATLSILSPSWKQSQWAVKEYLFSDEVGTPVFLTRAKVMGPTLVIAGIPYIDFVNDRATGFRNLERELNRKGLA